MIIHEGNITTELADQCVDCTNEYCCFIQATLRDTMVQLGERCDITISNCEDYIAERRSNES